LQRDDTELVALARSGDVDAYGVLYDRYQTSVYNLVLRMVGNVDDAEDLKQDVFLKTYRSLGAFKGTARFSTWLYRIATNVCLDEIRKRKPTASFDQMAEDSSWEPADSRTENNPEEQLSRKISEGTVQEALLRIPPHYRILIVLRHLDEMSYDEIATIVGCSVNALNVRLHRARESFRKALVPYLTEESHGDLPSGPKQNIAVY